jgi:hypothetical protein
MLRDAETPRTCRWPLLSRQFDIAPDRVAACVFRSAIRGFHQTRTASSHDSKAKLSDARSHLPGKLIVRMRLRTPGFQTRSRTGRRSEAP